MTIAETRILLSQLSLAVVVSRREVAATISSQALLSLADIEVQADASVSLAVPTISASFGHEQRLRLDAPTLSAMRRDARLVELVARGFASRDQLLAMEGEELEAIVAGLLS